MVEVFQDSQREVGLDGVIYDCDDGLLSMDLEADLLYAEQFLAEDE
jgi:hypothetical protein